MNNRQIAIHLIEEESKLSKVSKFGLTSQTYPSWVNTLKAAGVKRVGPALVVKWKLVAGTKDNLVRMLQHAPDSPVPTPESTVMSWDLENDDRLLTLKDKLNSRDLRSFSEIDKLFL